MSAALTSEEQNAIHDTLTALRWLGATKTALVLAGLSARLVRLAHCDSCGVLYDNAPVVTAYCHHCLIDMQAQEAREARGEHL